MNFLVKIYIIIWSFQSTHIVIKWHVTLNSICFIVIFNIIYFIIIAKYSNWNWFTIYIKNLIFRSTNTKPTIENWLLIIRNYSSRIVHSYDTHYKMIKASFCKYWT